MAFKALLVVALAASSALADHKPHGNPHSHSPPKHPAPAYPAPAYPAPKYPAPAPKYPAPHPQPSYQPAPPPHPKTSYHIPERNCTVDFEKSEAELCVPTLQTACSTEEVAFKRPVEQEKCIDIPMVHCKAEVRTETLDLCVYVYEKKDVETDAKTAQVKYTKNCETDYVQVCSHKRPKYGYGKPEEYCKEVPQETCYNRPQAESKDQVVTVTIPQPVKKCETKKIQIPDVSCTESKEKRCFKLTTLEDTTETIEKCVTTLAEPRCNKVSLNLPAQTCVEQVNKYQHGAHSN